MTITGGVRYTEWRDWETGKLGTYLGDAQNTFPVWNATPLVALDVYVQPGHTFATLVEPVLAHAKATIAQPLVLVPQWFTDAAWTVPPTPDTLAGYARWARDPAVVAVWGFTWDSRPTLVGLDARPALVDAIRRSLLPEATW